MCLNKLYPCRTLEHDFIKIRATMLFNIECGNVLKLLMFNYACVYAMAIIWSSNTVDTSLYLYNHNYDHVL